jgi:hypothetical protein
MPNGSPDFENNSNGEARILSYIIRVWREEPTTTNRQALWRGRITVIANGEHHYFNNINEIPGLIAAHLKLQP